MDRRLEEDATTYTAGKLLLCHLLPGTIYKVIFHLYCQNRKFDEEKYWTKIKKFNRQKDDTALLQYFGGTAIERTVSTTNTPVKDLITEDLLLLDKSTPRESEISVAKTQNLDLGPALEILREIETKHLATEKLEVLTRALSFIKAKLDECSADDMVPVLTFCMVRACIRNFGVHLQFTNDFLFQQLKSGEKAYIFTTIKACYMGILNDEIVS